MRGGRKLNIILDVNTVSLAPAGALLRELRKWSEQLSVCLVASARNWLPISNVVPIVLAVPPEHRTAEAARQIN